MSRSAHPPQRRLPWPLVASLSIHAALIAWAVPAARKDPAAAPPTISANLEPTVPLTVDRLETDDCARSLEMPEMADVEVTPRDVEAPPPDEPVMPTDTAADVVPMAPPLVISVQAGALRRRPAAPAAEVVPGATADAGVAPAAATSVAAAAVRAGVHRRAVPWSTNRGPEYPTAARAAGIVGTVVLLVHVDAAGFVSSVEVATSSGNVDLDRAAERAALAWRFEPAQRDGAGVPTVVRQRIRFQLEG